MNRIKPGSRFKNFFTFLISKTFSLSSVCSGSLAIKWSISVQDVSKVIAINPFDSVINEVVFNRMSMLAIGGQDWALMKLKKSVLGDLR